MAREFTLDENTIFDTSGIADSRFADHSGDIQHGYQLGSLTTGLVAYYPMEEGQGQVLHDAALDNLGQIEGATWNGSGQVGADSLSFDASNDGVRISNTPVMSIEDGSKITATAWVKSPDNSDTQRIVSSQVNPDGWWVRAFDHDDDSITEIEGYMRDGDLNTVSEFAETSIGDDEWHHIAAIFDNENNSIALFEDGVKLNSTTSTGETVGSVNITVDTFIGKEPDSSGGNGGVQAWDGEIDDVRIYDRALSQPEIEALYNLTQPQGALIEEHDLPTYPDDNAIARYEFEGDVTDSWGDNDGTDNTSAGYSDGVFGQAKEFDGSDDFVDCGTSFNDGSYTMSAWVSPNAVDSTDHDICGDLFSGTGAYISLDSSNQWGINHYEINDNLSTITGGSPSANEWANVVGSYDGDKLALYANGVTVAEATGIAFSSSSGKFGIGSFNGEAGPVNPWSGGIDDVRIYDRALSPIEVERLFNKGAYRINRSQI